jgi:restriction system protein
MAKKSKGPEFIRWFGPLLDALRDLGGSGQPREVSERIARNLNLPDEITESTLKSGTSRFHNQVAWARQYLIWEGLLEANSKRGIWALSERGQTSHLDQEAAVGIFSKWSEIHQQARKETETSSPQIDTDAPVIHELTQNEPGTLLDVLQSLSPSGFERICQRLLRESGFENVEVTGKSHDGGIDGFGILEINPFVSFKVLFQCKRYRGTVSRAQVGDFRNAMIGRAEKGMIITTGTFSKDAVREANRDGAPQIELIDGEKLVRMFERVELGLIPRKVYEVDFQFFEPYFR